MLCCVDAPYIHFCRCHSQNNMDPEDSRLGKLINQCKNNGSFSSWCFLACHQLAADVDVKIDALTKLQTEFESGIEARTHLTVSTDTY